MLRLTDLGAVAVLLVGVISAIKNRDKNGIYLLPKAIAFALGAAAVWLAMLLSRQPWWLAALLTLAVYTAAYLVYQFYLKQPSLFADWILYPFLLALAGYYIGTSYSGYLFPSPAVEAVISVLEPMSWTLAPVYEICMAFSRALSSLLYGIMDVLFRILPDVGLYAVHFNIPGLVGAVLFILLLSLLCSLIGKGVQKKTK